MSDILEAERPDAPSGPTAALLEGIVRQRCVSATYNRKRMILAPHVMYSRNGGFYVDALVVSREGMLPREPKIGAFKLEGLSELRLLERAFEVSRLYEPDAEKYAGVTLMAVEHQN